MRWNWYRPDYIYSQNLIQMISPKVKGSSTRFLHELEGTLEEAAKAETICSLELLSNRLKALKAKLTKGMVKKQQFQDLIIKCEVLVKQKLRNARIKGKFTPSLVKSQSQKEFVMTPKYSDVQCDKTDKTTKVFTNQICDTKENYQELKDRLTEIRREVKREKSQKYRLRGKVEELQHSNRVKEQQLEILKQNVTRLNGKMQKIQTLNEVKQIPIMPVVQNPSSPLLSPKVKHQTIKDFNRTHNLYLEEKEEQLSRFEERISQKNKIINGLEQRIILLQAEMVELRGRTNIKWTQGIQNIQSLRVMLKSSNDKLEAAIRQKLDLREVIKQLETKTQVFGGEIDKLISQNAGLKREVEKGQKILEHKLNQGRRQAHYVRRNIEPRIVQSQNDKILLFDKLDEKDREVTALRDSALNFKHQIDILSVSLKSKQQRISQLQQQLFRKQTQFHSVKQEFTRVRSQEFNHTLKHSSLRDQGRRTELHLNKSLDITKKLNALEGIRNIIRRFPHGQ